jgi:hypothetical protein
MGYKPAARGFVADKQQPPGIDNAGHLGLAGLKMDYLAVPRSARVADTRQHAMTAQKNETVTGKITGKVT